LAIYIPDSTRRRRMVGIAAVCLIVGFLAGGALGRATSSGVDDSVREVRALATDAATALQRLPIEYEQAVAGEGGESMDTIVGALGRARATLDAAFEEIDVFGPAARTAAYEAFDRVAQAIDDGVVPNEFERVIAAAVAAVQQTFGLNGG
jgi:hypothetical protein